MRLHIQGLQQIAGVTQLEISSLQATYYPIDGDTVTHPVECRSCQPDLVDTVGGKCCLIHQNSDNGPRSCTSLLFPYAIEEQICLVERGGIIVPLGAHESLQDGDHVPFLIFRQVLKSTQFVLYDCRQLIC